MVPEAVSTFFLPRLLGHSRALALTLTGDVIPASHEWLSPLFASLVEKTEQVLPEALKLAERIVKETSGISAAMIKALLWKGAETPEEQHLLDSKGWFRGNESDRLTTFWIGLIWIPFCSLAAMYATGAGPDAREGVRSFMDKRPANFTGSVSKDMGGGTAFEGWWVGTQW